MNFRALLTGLALLASPMAYAEIDGGVYYLRGPAPESAERRGTVTVTENADGTTESWVVCDDLTDPLSALEAPVVLVTADWDFRDSTSTCSRFVSFTVDVRYEEVLLDDLYAASRRARSGARTERVVIEDETVGWRITGSLKGQVRETWIMTQDYAPPTPSRTHARGAAHAKGWSRAYVDAVTLEAADAADVAEEIEAYAEEGNFDGARLARATYAPRSATRTELRRAGLAPR
jgi:hypothetical protein